MQKKQIAPQKKKDLWEDWTLFKKNEYTNPGLQLKKQGASIKNDHYGQFTYRPSYSSPPSMQEFYEAVINGIIKRYQMGLYQGEYHYFVQLQNCLHEFIKLLNFKSEILVEVFQSITNINLSKQVCPNIVVPCVACHMYIYINYHCQKCFSAFYCDKTCQKNHQTKHDQECRGLTQLTPSIIYPLQVELHCGGDLGDNVEIYYQHENRTVLKYQGIQFVGSLYKILLKNRWLKNNDYSVVLSGDSDQYQNKVTLEHRVDEATKEKKEQKLGEKKDSNETSSQTEDELFLQMPCIQEMRVIFLNQGAILQDIIKETFDLYTRYIHIYYYPA